jgi:hypothetical protein
MVGTRGGDDLQRAAVYRLTPEDELLFEELLQAASPAAAEQDIAFTASRWERRFMSGLLLTWPVAQAYR